MKSLPDRGSLTTLMLDQLETTGFPIGDAEMPEHDPDTGVRPGWTGDPGAPGSSFTPYTVLTPQTATISTGSFADPQDGWQLPYSLSSFGVSRVQCEAMANLARKALRAMKGTDVVLDGETYRVQQVWYPAIGGVGRVDAESPSRYGEQDTVTIWISQ